MHVRARDETSQFSDCVASGLRKCQSVRGGAVSSANARAEHCKPAVLSEPLMHSGVDADIASILSPHTAPGRVKPETRGLSARCPQFCISRFEILYEHQGDDSNIVTPIPLLLSAFRGTEVESAPLDGAASEAASNPAVWGRGGSARCDVHARLVRHSSGRVESRLVR